MAESIHERLQRTRPPRVHIKYEVYKGDAIELKELPFVMGVIGDFSGDPTKPLDPLAKRKFIKIDRDNINDVLARMTPGLNFKVENTLKGDGSEMGVQLKFESMEDFEPANVVKQVEPLRKLLETRNKLRDLLVASDRNENIENDLEKILKNADEMKKLAGELGVSAGDSPAGEGDKS
jgi:type VI secretion system protein ImpB